MWLVSCLENSKIDHKWATINVTRYFSKLQRSFTSTSKKCMIPRPNQFNLIRLVCLLQQPQNCWHRVKLILEIISDSKDNFLQPMFMFENMHSKVKWAKSTLCFVCVCGGKEISLLKQKLTGNKCFINTCQLLFFN